MTEKEVTTTEGISQSFMPPYLDDEVGKSKKKARYLSYIVAGFSVMEACKLAKVWHKSVMRWRKDDPNFIELERKVAGELREQLSNQLIDIEFTRNFHLVLTKDFEILFKDAQSIPLTDKEQQYLLVIRKFYTPQQLIMIKQLVSGNGEHGESFDFTKTVLEIRLTKEEKFAR